MNYTLDYYISRNPAKTTRQTVSKKEICLVAAVYDFKINLGSFIIGGHLTIQWVASKFQFCQGEETFF